MLLKEGQLREEPNPYCNVENIDNNERTRASRDSKAELR
jgi:hypothetical protein